LILPITECREKVRLVLAEEKETGQSLRAIPKTSTLQVRGKGIKQRKGVSPLRQKGTKKRKKGLMTPIKSVGEGGKTHNVKDRKKREH